MILITGASGFVGRRLAAAARKETSGSDLFCYTSPWNCAYENEGKAILARAGFTHAEADLLIAERLPKMRTTPEVVFHLAANSGTLTNDHRANDIGTRNLIQSLPDFGRGCHLVFTSSVAVTDTRPDYQQPLTESAAESESPLTS